VPAADQVALSQTTTVYYADGTTEMGTFSEINRTIIDPSTLPDYVGQAVVASEDRTFYTNAGIDLKGILRALVNNVRGGERQGGSTLTQQYVERYYVGETTSYTGKVKEAVLAVKINREQSKDEILGNYINTIYFGRGAYGIEAASKAYFGHPAADMSVSEAAMLAGIIPA
ncbi:penicillin-binding protein, partial [Tsukamurella conjunctivitidis]